MRRGPVLPEDEFVARTATMKRIMGEDVFYGAKEIREAAEVSVVYGITLSLTRRFAVAIWRN